jgi:hypothetical protein
LNANVSKVKSAACRERSRQRDGGDGEGKAERLDHVLLVQIERPEIGHSGDSEYACRSRGEAGQRADQRAEPPFGSWAYGKAYGREAEHGVSISSATRRPRVGGAAAPVEDY